MSDALEKRSEFDNLLNSMSMDQKLRFAADYIYGFSRTPPTIKEFIFDDYFMGIPFGSSVYPYWVDQLEDLYPNPIISPYRYVVATGAIGTGKSTFSILAGLYEYCRFLCLRNPVKTFNFTDTTPFTIRGFNLSKGKAYDVLISKMERAIERSPFFQDEFKRMDDGFRPESRIGILPARNSSDIISECLIFSIISEINFMRDDVAEDIIATCDSRMNSRLIDVQGVFGKTILDSSSTVDESVVNRFIDRYPDRKRLKIMNTRLWEAKAHKGEYFRLGSFNVYAGSEGIKPHIIDEKEDTSKYDKDRIIKVPEELRSNFVLDITKALNDQAGISIGGSDDFFQNKDIIDNCAIEPEVVDQVIVVDFFDDTEIFDIIGQKILKVLPKDRKLYGSMDLGLTSDNCGIAISYIDSAKYLKIGTKKVFVPKIKCPVAFALSRKSGQETSIEKIINFWIWLSTVRDLGMVTMDQFQSASVHQALTKQGINNKKISTVVNNLVYVNLKNLMLKGQVTFPNIKLLKNELSHLRTVGLNKVDHPDNGSKDIADALSSSIYSIIEAGESSAEPAVNESIKMYKAVTKELARARLRNSIYNRNILRITK